MTAPKNVIEVAIALVWQNGRVLVALRPPSALEGNRWEFPGGKVEAGESLPAALRRECQEELGVDIEDIEPAWLSEVVRPDAHLRLHFFHARLRAGAIPQPLCAQRLAFVAIAELAGLPFCSADAELLQALAEGRVRPLTPGAQTPIGAGAPSI